MNKTLILGIVLLLGITLFGCSPNKNGYLSQAKQSQSNHVTKTDSKSNQEEFKQSDAILKAIEQHNISEEVKSDIDFPTIIKSGETVIKEFKTGGPRSGLTVKLELTLDAKRDDDKYIVTLTEDYNSIVNGTKAISFWKYEVSVYGVKLIDKKEDGNLVKIIK